MLLQRLFRPVVASVVVGLTLAAGVVHAAGWQEIHQSSDDVRLDVGADGVATVQHHLRYRVVAGHFKTLEATGFDPRMEFATDAVVSCVSCEKGGLETVAHVEPVAKAPGAIRLTLDDAKGLGRGTYEAIVKYRVDLVATKMLSRDGALWKLAWTSPVAIEGQDGARVTFDLPAGPTEPRLAGTDDSVTTLSTLRRGADRDELELVRAHVPRGEAATWAVRVDPKAFPRVVSPELRPAPPREVETPAMLSSSFSHVLVPAGMAVIAGLLAALLRAKQRAVHAAASARKAIARPLLPLPSVIAPFAYGVVAALAFVTLLWSSPIAGALLVVLAMALAAHRAPRTVRRPRGPGSWKAVAAKEALLPAAVPGSAFDLATRKGALAFVLLWCGVIVIAWALRAQVPHIVIALPLAAMSLVPIFVTGTRSQLPPTPAELAARILRPTRDALAKTMDLAHVQLDVLVRMIDKQGQFDEVRLVCAPCDRTPGLRAVELASAGVAFPEVLVRFDDGSAAAARVRQLAAGLPIVPGRTPEERVLRIAPVEPTPGSTALLLRTVLLGLEGRRASDRVGEQSDRASQPKKPWRGRERRLRPILPSSPPVPAL